jgi:Peptidase family S41
MNRSLPTIWVFRALRSTAACVVAGAFLGQVFPALASAQTVAAAPTAAGLTEEQAKFDVSVAKRALIELHPALTKYNTQTEMDTAFARFEARGNAARNVTEMYLAATELAAAIRCGHTWTNTLNQAGAVKTALMEAPNKLPFHITPIESRWLVTASAVKEIKRGDEILAINGATGPDIVKTMMPYLRADGSSDNKRIVQLSHDRNATSMMDLVWPLLSPPVDGRYNLQVRHADGRTENIAIAATTLAARKSALEKQDIKERDEAWTLKIENDVATMTLPTFSFWRSNFNASKWIDESFAKLNAEKVAQLIIDIRDNEGGDGAINRALLSHLLKQKFTWPATQSITSYERAPYILAKYLDTWDYSFFDRTGNVEKLGERRYLFAPKAQRNVADRTIAPKPTAFAGKTYLLIGGENSSATFQLAYLVKLSGAAALVGQRTGGNLRGLNGGELAWVTLPNSGVAIDIPLIASNPIEAQPDSSIEPDILVKRTFDARAADRDLEMEAVMRIITATLRR